MIWIISGPTCAGKSSFIQHGDVKQFTGLLSSTPTVFPGDVEHDQGLPITFFFHYNILRPYRKVSKKWEWKRFFLSLLTIVDLSGNKRLVKRYFALPSIFQKDLAWQKLLKINLPKKAIVLVTGKQELIKRTGSRSLFETDFFVPHEVEGYPSREWSEYLVSIDLAKVYLDWIKELKHQNIEHILIDSTNNFYREIELHDALQIINDN